MTELECKQAIAEAIACKFNKTWRIKIGLSKADRLKMANDIYNQITQELGQTPKGVATESEILAFNKNDGIWIASDNGYYYFWNGTQYVKGQPYQAVGIADNSIAPIKTTFMYAGKNLYNYKASRKGFYLDGEGNDIPNENFFASDFIKVEPNTTYGISGTRSEDQSTYIEFDANKKVIKGLYKITTHSFITTNEAHYIKIDGSITRINEVMLNKGSLKPFEEFGSFVKPEYMPPLNIGDGTIETKQTNFAYKSNNLYDRLKSTFGYYMDGLGRLVENDTFATSDYIEIKPNTNYSCTSAFSSPVLGGIRRISYYDENKKFIQRIDSTKTFKTPSNAKYLRFDYYNDTQGTSFYANEMLNEGSELKPFEEFNIGFIGKENGTNKSLNYYRYIRPTKTLSIFLKANTDDEYININYSKIEIPYTPGNLPLYQNADLWRINEAYTCTIENGLIKNKKLFITNGAWETAISIVGFPDFIGTLHGYEKMTNVRFLIDGRIKTFNKNTGLIAFKQIEVLYNANLIEKETENNVACNVTRKYVFEGNTLDLTQQFTWKNNYTINQGFIAMLPIQRKNQEGEQITDTALCDYDYVEYDVSNLINHLPISNNLKNVQWAEIYGKASHIKVTTNVTYKKPNEENYFFVATNAELYNKFYYSYCDNLKVNIGDKWDTNTKFVFNVDKED